jgi:hypothetical protein
VFPPIAGVFPPVGGLTKRNLAAETVLRQALGTLHPMLFTAKCYWPGVDEAELKRAAARARRASSGYLGALLFPEDDLVLCLFQARSSSTVKRVSERAGIPCERVIETTWIGPPNTPTLLEQVRG